MWSRSGESLALIAQRYQVSLAVLRSANNLKSDVIKVGQTPAYSEHRIWLRSHE